MKRTLMALALAAADDSIHDIRSFLQQMRSRAQMIWKERRSVFSLEPPVIPLLQISRTQL